MYTARKKAQHFKELVNIMLSLVVILFIIYFKATK